MRLDFNVLWIDDQPARVHAQIDAIARQMQSEGFQFNPTLCGSVNEVRVRVSDNVFTDEIDLILVDWDLGGGVAGQDAIAATREAIPYKDVVFYSAMKPAAELRQLAYQTGLEGVYCASREELVDEVMGVFESLVKKVLDLDHTRGIVLGATSDIDNMVNECLAAIHVNLDLTDKQAMLAEALSYIDRRIIQLTGKANELRTASNLSDLLEAHFVLTSYDRLRILSGALKGDAFKQHKGFRDSVVKYQQHVVRERNILGHLKLLPEGKPQSVIDSKGQAISLEKTRELRRLILDLRSDFRRLLLSLQASS